VDDDLIVREGISTLLGQWGCEVIAAGSDDEAVERIALQAAAPDIVVADYQLRGQRTGVQAIARLRRELGREIPALIITGDTAPERLREARGSGHPLVHKPVRPALLRTFLRNARRKGTKRE
jgi:two-component system, sensor histidine kinase